jgi:16S rRNA (cytidine1402-2'-O)-methyltransferase
MAGRLTLVAGPLGNLGDLSTRAIEALGQAEIWIVEDTRVSSRLQSHLDLKRPMWVLNDHTPPIKVASYVKALAEGRSAALLTDGGTPCVSDPGSMITDLCYEQGVEVEAIPGPSAVTTALMLSGFFAQRFAFLGFLGRKPGAIREELEPFKDSTLTIVLFESPHRIDKLCEAAVESLGKRRFAVCRELTKMHQQVCHGMLPDLPAPEVMPRKGEITLVIEGKRRKSRLSVNTD